MNIHNSEFMLSAVKASQYPPAILPEITFVGRSNVGKSSLINKLVNRNKFAKVSSTPGKTATINFYSIDNTILFADLPGYGYAKTSKSQRNMWAVMIEEYLFSNRLTGIYQLVDARHKPTGDDILMLDWIRQAGIGFTVVATKIDKLKKSEYESNLQRIRTVLKLSSDDKMIPFSAEKGDGRDELWADIEDRVNFRK